MKWGCDVPVVSESHGDEATVNVSSLAIPLAVYQHTKTPIARKYGMTEYKCVKLKRRELSELGGRVLVLRLIGILAVIAKIAPRQNSQAQTLPDRTGADAQQQMRKALKHQVYSKRLTRSGGGSCQMVVQKPPTSRVVGAALANKEDPPGEKVCDAGSEWTQATGRGVTAGDAAPLASIRYKAMMGRGCA